MTTLEAERDAMVAAVVADPTDYTLRLKYADWLDEHDRNRRNGDDEPLAVTRGRGVVAASAERQP